MIKRQCWVKAVGIIGVGFFSPPVAANLYSGALASYSDVELYNSTNSLSEDGSLWTMQAQLGYFFSDYFALETRYGSSVKRDNGLAVNSLASGFIKLNVPVSERTAIYGLLGYSAVQVHHRSVGKQNAQDMNFGLGVHYALDRHSAITFEMINYHATDEVHLSAITLGFQHRF